MSKGMIVRVQSAQHGTRRLQTKPTERVQDFLQKVKEEFQLPKNGWSVYLSRDKAAEVVPAKSKTLNSFKIKHGDMLYLHSVHLGEEVVDGAAVAMDDDTSVPSKNRPSSVPSVPLDEVDQILCKTDGRIHRDRNEQLCRHGPQGKCLHCVPFEPYDEEYLKTLDPPIKFLSFHSYIRHLTGGVDRGKFAMLENLSCKIKPGCKEHLPWPAGICTKCQPSAITLNRQKYRHVDYIQFENAALMERFLNYWRSTGCQRMGIMYGRYEPHKDMPLGIKAVVAAIYEPPQVSSKNSIELQEDPQQSSVNGVAEKLGLRPVGWIFTDLVALDLQLGTVKNFRGDLESHFLSAEECIMAADFQKKHPNPCQLSPEGHFGSKFVTVIVTGDGNNQIHFEGYQVSNQCMALVTDDCLIPTRDASELGYIKESSNEQYVPDVFYKDKDSYGNEVTHIGRPLPVEYLLVDMPAAFPVEPIYTFTSASLQLPQPFPIANRENMGQLQNFDTFAQYLRSLSGEHRLDAISDFHLLTYIANCDMLPLKGEMDSLLEAIKTENKDLAHSWFKSEAWGTVEHLLEAQEPIAPQREGSYVGPNAMALPPIGGSSAGGSSGATWTCAHCTFINTPNTSTCEMCGLPK